MNINELMKQAHDNAMKRGFYKCIYCGGTGNVKYGTCIEKCFNCKGTGKDALTNVCDDIMLEVEELRISTFKKEFDKDSRESELSDIILILLAYCEEEHIDIVQAIIAKNEYNKTRED